VRLLIVDDEPIARRRLARMIEEMSGVEVAGEAVDGVDALRKIDRLAPDAVLLDIQMPGLSGIDLAARGESLPPIIFVTAHDEHAVKAFELCAVDYLLKPVDPERLAQALSRLAERRPGAAGAALRDALETLFARGSERAIAPELPRVSARTGSTLRLIDPREVSCFHASDKYSLCRHSGKEWIVDESLSTLEERLAPHGFMRIHRSRLVQLARVSALHTEDGSLQAELDDGGVVPVSRRLVAELKRRLGVD
jgi:two-component system LytT family response regulator